MSISKLANSDENGKKPAVYLTVDELTLLFGSVIETKLKEFKPIVHTLPKEETHLNFMQAVSFLKISKPTFVKLRREGKIKGLKVGLRRILFNRTDLEQYLQDNHE